ncbi:hypothetical protein E0Z10_g4659 [Xylaria hypoxylon]|uniref:Uncharacterized protein n=1 Tax=Xylaria hypoxylon TaxID=37992 RepID=A0A4Z0Z010_9PEZI|nr:hypothetical protein E0Z10_g4659 [Xylaria hypoxylon]
MDDPITPGKKVQPMAVAHQLTPPTTAAKMEAAGAGNHLDYSLTPSVRRLLYGRPVTTHEAGENEDSVPTSFENGVKEPHDTQNSSASAQVQFQNGQVQPQQEVKKKFLDVQLHQDKPEAQNQPAVAMQQPNDTKRQLNTHGQPESDITQWLYSSKSREQRRQRFDSVLHSLWPSNDEFNAARHPFYDPEKDGLYDDFIKYQEWDGDCPYDDDDYDPFTDPTRSTEVWQPKIGDEGIEDEHDLRMVLKARREHRARSKAIKAYRQRRNQPTSTKHIGSDTTRVPLSDSDDSGSDSGSDTDSDSDSGSDDDGVGMKGVEPAINTEEPSSITTPLLKGNSVLQPTISAKGIRVFGDEKPTSGRGRPRGSKNKPKGRKKPTQKKRGHEENPDSTYKYNDDNDDSEDEQPVYKRAKKIKSEFATGDKSWKAQTRAAARRAGYVSMDGSCDADIDSSASSAGENSFDETDEGRSEKKSLLSRFTTFITR